MDKSAYAAAGVDIAAGDYAVTLMKQHVQAATRAEVLGGLGGFAGFFDISAAKNYRHPVLATSTDGVGTKVAIAQAMDIHDTIGYDLIGMLVDDLVVCGAEPLFVTDYIACGKVFPEKVADIVKGIAQACKVAGAALVGGETAEHPGLMAEHEYDIAGATTGIVEKDKILGAHLVQPGDQVIALGSSGLHSNGYSLARHVLFEQAKFQIEAEIPELGQSLGAALLTPTKIYALDILRIIAAVEVHAISHITGGGLAGNLVRVLPDGVKATIDRSTWQPGAIFELIRQAGKVSQPDLEATLNMGVGMALVLPAVETAKALAVARENGLEAWLMGEVVAAPKTNAEVELVGNYS